MKPILEIKHVSKQYKLRGQETPYLTMRDAILGKNKREKTDSFWALNDINFNIYPGESIGVVGKNGAGKSTLLKILSRITPPTKGEIISRGRIASLLEVGTGFHAELTGIENIFLNGSILGLKKIEIKKRLDEIVDFSGIERFLETPLKHYSSGMQLRLAFAVAAHLEPEILIIDEVLAVGDAEFQKKSLGKMEDITKQGRTVIFVSHNMAAVQNLCEKGVLLQNGEVIANDEIGTIVGQYRESINLFTSKLKESPGVFNLLKYPKTKPGKSRMLKVFTYCDNKLNNIFYSGCNFMFEIEVKNDGDYDNLLFGFTIKNNAGEAIISMTNRHTGHAFHIQDGGTTIFKTEITQLPIYREGEYFVDLYWGNHSTNHEILIDAFSFEIEKTDIYGTGMMPPSKDNLIHVESINFTLKK